jgi:hypothetical protein
VEQSGPEPVPAEALPGGAAGAAEGGRLNPQFFSTLTLLASTLHALGDDAAALPVLERAHNLNPDDAQVTSRLEQLRAAIVKGKAIAAFGGAGEASEVVHFFTCEWA